MPQDVRLYLLAASMTKSGADATTFSTVHGYQLCTSPDEAKGRFLVSAMEMKPGMAVADILCMEVPVDVCKQVAEASGG